MGHSKHMGNAKHMENSKHMVGLPTGRAKPKFTRETSEYVLFNCQNRVPTGLTKTQDSQCFYFPTFLT